MDRTAKEKVVSDLTKKFDESNFFILTHNNGLSVGEITSLRNQLRESGSTFKVVKNSLAKIAVINSGHGYQNNKVVVSSTKYPPEKQEDIFKTFVGISTFDNCIYAKNHNFKNNSI